MKKMKDEEQVKLHKNRTMFRRLIIPILIVALVQVGICYGLVGLSGGVDKLKSEVYKEFHAIVNGRSEQLQNMLLLESDYVQKYKERIEQKVMETLDTQKKSIGDLDEDEQLNELIVLQVTDDIEEMIESGMGTGAFIVLDGYGEGSEAKYGYYLRNTRIDSTEKKHYAVLRGTEEIVAKVEIPTHKNWRSEFKVSEEESYNFYQKIDEAITSDMRYENSDWGYWSPKFTMYDDEQEIITYTVPLTDEQGAFYGVLGIEISTEVIEDNLPYTELTADGTSSYYLAHRDSKNERYATVADSSASGKDITNKSGYVEYTTYEGADNVYLMEEELMDNYVGVVSKMDLYSAKSPFATEQWAIIGVENEDELLADHSRLLTGFFVAITIVILVSIFEAWYICFRIISYIRQMSHSVRKLSPKEQLKLDRVSVREIDELGEAIMEVNERGTSSAKLVEIIDMAGVPVGAMELKKGENFVFCTKSAADILEFHQVDKENHYISRKAFDVEIAVLKKNLTVYSEEDDTYHMLSKNGMDKWIRIKQKKEDDRIQIAVLDVTNEIIEKQKIEYERDYDILTRLLNRNAFRAKMGQMLQRGNLGIAAVVMMDLDNLKYFNDTYGHEYGDRYIREAAAVLSTMNQHNALVARMSGDEFLMFISGYSSKDEVRKLIKEVHQRLLESYITVPTGEQIRLRASAGIAWYPEDALYLDELIKYADFAMYETKSSKKGNIKEFNRSQYQKNAVLFTGKEELNRLLENENTVQYIFQPIVDVATGEVFGYEALMRPMIDALRSPEDVMRLAKAQSKLYQVEKLTWMAALDAVEKNRKPGDAFKIFINSVPNHVLDGTDIAEVEASYSHILERVIIEIIESEQTDKYCMETKCEWAKKHGASIALDDFGTGYSNESTLLYINPDYVKLDISIINNIHKDEGRQKIVQGLLAYTKLHGIKVIAEGIDIYEEMETLIQLGVDYIQGWYLAQGYGEFRDISSELKEQIRKCVKGAPKKN